MKTRLPMVLALSCVAFIGALWVANTMIAKSLYKYEPSAEHESAFLHNYNVKSVVAPFALKDDGVSVADGTGSGSGREFVTNKREIEAMLATQTDMRPSLMAALNNDLAAQLLANRAIITAKSGDPGHGFRFTYRDGTSAGTVTLSPLEKGQPNHRSLPLPEGTQSIRARIVISEKWFPAEDAAVRASAAPQ